MSGRPLLYILNDPGNPPVSEFVTLFSEEGYDTREVTHETLLGELGDFYPSGVIGNF